MLARSVAVAEVGRFFSFTAKAQLSLLEPPKSPAVNGVLQKMTCALGRVVEVKVSYLVVAILTIFSSSPDVTTCPLDRQQMTAFAKTCEYSCSAGYKALAVGLQQACPASIELRLISSIKPDSASRPQCSLISERLRSQEKQCEYECGDNRISKPISRMSACPNTIAP